MRRGVQSRVPPNDHQKTRRRSGSRGKRRPVEGSLCGEAGGRRSGDRTRRVGTHRVGGDRDPPRERSVLAPVRRVGARHDESVDRSPHQRPHHLHGQPWDRARAQGDRTRGAQGSAIPHPHPMPALTVRGGRVPLPRAGGQEHGERRVGHLEELGHRRSLDGLPLSSLPTQGSLSEPNPRARLEYPH